jgi:prophage tail gpP-like protein
MRVFARLTTKIGGHGYRDYDIYRVENYAIDSALDTDTDTWSCDIGDPNGKLIDILRRDTEVRVAMFRQSDERVAANRTITQLNYGFADTISMTHDGKLSLSGRDVTATAVDSTATPGYFAKQKPDKIVSKQARELGITKQRLEPLKVRSSIFTDGSESYWEFWYRLYRHEKMWIWAEPDGRLIADQLNYSGDPFYFFGSPSEDHPIHKDKYIRVISLEFRKSTTSRVYEVQIFGSTGKRPADASERDATIRDWIKKPRKFMLDSNVKNMKEARTAAYEEIFEGKVGAVEISLVVKDPGYVIRQNKIARINLPQIGLFGDFFVVGTRLTGGTGGFQQEVRLRQKQYAITRRIPDDPDLAETPKIPPESSTVHGVNLPLTHHRDWTDFFVNAAKKHHRPWVFAFFLGAIIAVSDHETGIRNIRERKFEHEWDTFDYWEEHGMNIHAYHSYFANDPGTPGNEFTSERPSNPDAGVGPFQLTSHFLKLEAADLYGKYKGDEYNDGRWDAESNIMVGAHYIHDVVTPSETRGSWPITEEEFWKHLTGFTGGGAIGEQHVAEIKKMYDDKWKGAVDAWLKKPVKRDPQDPADKAAEEDIPPRSETGGFIGTKTLSVFLSTLKAQLGCHYQAYDPPNLAAGPCSEGFDCSGLVVYAGAIALGMSNSTFIGNFGRSTYNFMAAAHGWTKIAGKSDMLPGDVLLFGSIADVHHCGVYVGNNTFIQSPQTGDVVKFTSLADRDDLQGIRRLPGMYEGQKNQ